MKTKEELLQQYVDNLNKIHRINEEQKEVLNELRNYADHKVGEIIKWTIPAYKARVGGDRWNPIYGEVPAKEKTAVLTKVNISVTNYNNRTNFGVSYNFSGIKKDGHVSQVSVWPRRDYVWTGEIHEDFKK